MVHASVFQDGFYWDDRYQILEGKLNRSWSSIPQIFQSEVWRNVGTEGRLEFASVDTFRPLFNLSLLVDYQLFGLSAWWYHLVNLVVHLLNVVLFHRCLKLAGLESFALPFAALFSLHPATVNCIHYVSSRPDGAAAGLCLATLCCALWSEGHRRLPLLLMCLSFFAAMLWKETGILMPAIVPALFWVSGPKKTITQAASLGGLLLGTLGLYFLLRLNALGAVKAVDGSGHALNMVVNFPFVLGRFALVFFGLTPGLPLQMMDVLKAPYSAGALVGVACFYGLFGFFVLRGLLRRRLWAGATTWILLTMAPPVAAVVRTEIADGHYFYMPTVGTMLLCAAVTRSMKKLLDRHRAGAPLLAAAFLASAAYSHSVSKVFLTEITFYTGILETGRGSPRARYNLANAYLREEQPLQAIGHYRRALSSDLLAPQAHNNLSVTFMNLGQFDKSEIHARAAVELRPEDSKYRSNWGLALLKLGQFEAGARQVEDALRLDSANATARSLAKQICAHNRTVSATLCPTRTPSAQ